MDKTARPKASIAARIFSAPVPNVNPGSIMTDFPRGWTLSAQVNGGVAGITVPAISGVGHVLDSFDAVLADAGGGAGPYTINLISSDGVFANIPIGYLFLAAAGKDEASGSGLDLATGPGASLTVSFSGSGAATAEFLLIQGHDI